MVSVYIDSSVGYGLYSRPESAKWGGQYYQIYNNARVPQRNDLTVFLVSCFAAENATAFRGETLVEERHETSKIQASALERRKFPTVQNNTPD